MNPIAIIKTDFPIIDHNQIFFHGSDLLSIPAGAVIEAIQQGGKGGKDAEQQIINHRPRPPFLGFQGISPGAIGTGEGLGTVL